MFRMAAIFIGLAKPFALRDMVRRDTGLTGGKASTEGRRKLKKKNNRRKNIKKGEHEEELYSLWAGKEEKRVRNEDRKEK